MGRQVFAAAFACGQAFQQRQECLALIPRGVRAFVDDVVAAQCADGDEVDLRGDAELGGKGAVGGGDFLVNVFVETEQVEFVDGGDDVRCAQEFEDGTVAFGLGQQIGKAV